MKKIVACLSGGLGNQMFQYAAAKSLALEYGCKLYIDSISGFANDYTYNRSFELGIFQIDYNYVSFMDRIAQKIFRYNPIFLFKKRACVNSLGPLLYIYEPDVSLVYAVDGESLRNVNYLIGYWQSEIYFEKYSELIHKNFKLPIPTDQAYISLANDMQEKESVAIGLRFYEESPDPLAHSKNRATINFDAINHVIKEIQRELGAVKFYIFSTSSAKRFSELSLPENSEFVIEENGFDNHISTLWLMTQAKHHIITNSSFYWWAAWIADENRKKIKSEKRFVFASKSFINLQSIRKTWLSF